MSNYSNLYGAYVSLIAPFINEMVEIGVKQENHKKEILNKWNESMNFPRKKKKEMRKKLKIEWAIANWNPMNEIFH